MGGSPIPIKITQAIGAHSRLPEISLLHFDGDIYKWPAFRDRFFTHVEQCVHLTDIEKFYYLIGCLKGGASDAIRAYPFPAKNSN